MKIEATTSGDGIEIKRSWIFMGEGHACIVDEQEVRSSCFFRDHVMGRLECRRMTGQAGEVIENHAAIRFRKQMRIAAINASGGAIDLAQALIRDRLLSEVEVINIQIFEIMKRLPIDAEPHAIAREAWRERVEVQRNATILSLANDVRETTALIAKLHMEQTSETSEPERAKIREAYARERSLVARLVAQAKSSSPEFVDFTPTPAEIHKREQEESSLEPCEECGDRPVRSNGICH